MRADTEAAAENLHGHDAYISYRQVPPTQLIKLMWAQPRVFAAGGGVEGFVMFVNAP